MVVEAREFLAPIKVGGQVKGSAVVALVDGANISTDASLGEIFSVTLGGNRTMNAPTNAVDGMRITYRIRQDGTGSRTLTWASTFAFTADVPSPVLSSNANKTDYVTFIYNLSNAKWECMGWNRGA